MITDVLERGVVQVLAYGDELFVAPKVPCCTPDHVIEALQVRCHLLGHRQ